MLPNPDSWDLSMAPVTPRSRLYSLEPVGAGTALVESLSGYVIRLAEAHAVSVADLIKVEMSRFLESSLLSPIQITYVVNGVGETARQWVRAIETLTLRCDLRYLTLLPLAPLFSSSFLFRNTRAWCPECYNEMSVAGKPIYEPLLWCVGSVEICPRHLRPLSTACPHCEKPLQPMARTSRAGYCSRCYLWLGATREQSSKIRGYAPTEYQLWLAEAVGELLINACSRGTVPPDRVRSVLLKYTRAIAEGNIAAVAELAGSEKGVLTSWLNRDISARLETLLRTWYRLKLPVACLFDDASFPTTNDQVLRAQEITRKRQIAPKRTRQQICAALQQALNEKPAPSLGTVARRLGYTTASRLRSADKSLCAKIVLNHRRSGCSQWWRQAGAKVICEPARINKILEDYLHGSEPILSIDHIAVELGFARGESLRQKFPNLCLAISAKAKEQDLARMEAVLKQALQESPPPSLHRIALRLGFSEARLWRRAPLLCQELLIRKQTYASECHTDLENKLKAALLETPPPSLIDLCNRFGISTWFVITNHPELRLAITARYRQYRKQEVQARWDGVRKEIQQIVANLYAQGRYPSVPRVTSLLRNGFVGAWRTMRNAVHDARREYKSAPVAGDASPDIIELKPIHKS